MSQFSLNRKTTLVHLSVGLKLQSPTFISISDIIRLRKKQIAAYMYIVPVKLGTENKARIRTTAGAQKKKKIRTTAKPVCIYLVCVGYMNSNVYQGIDIYP